MSQVTSLRKRHRFNSRMIRIVLLISFLFFFGRFVYSAIGAWQHHQSKKESQQITQPQQASPAQTDVR
ncbi:YfgG family protein [Citrobacter sp. Cu096]|uniref:YfgG family protein n=1 Tax=Citrobacter sp. Cu096 TaxID=2985158 RepID=UPI002577C69F|nr:YfgG family protein [Citrobacter sp. Cu096]MDM2741329.1 YfgG family protein [Citrobacter sp. Cu096]